MTDQFLIYPDRLKGGHVEKIDMTLAPSFIDVEESDLSFKDSVRLKGSASRVDDSLVLQLDVETVAYIPCSICNHLVPVKILIPHFYLTEDLENTRDGVFNFKESLREEILLNVPRFAECDQGNCEERESVAKFLKKNEGDRKESYHPFADL